MAAPVFSAASQATRAEANSKRVEVFFLPYGSTTPLGAARFSGRNGFYKGAVPTVAQGATLLCTVNELADIGLSAVGEEVVVMPGKADRTKRDSTGLNFSLTFQGNAVGTFKFLLGISPHTNEAIDWAFGDFGLVGSIIIYRYDDTQSLPVQSTLIKDVKMKVETVQGIPNSGRSMQAITFYQDVAWIRSVTGNQLWTYSLFVDDGASIVNAAAPDGVLVAFVLDDANNSQTAVPPQPIQFNPSGTGYQQYLAVLRVNGTVITPSAAAVATAAQFATATITFGAAPADGSSLLAIYAVDSNTYVLPMLHSTTGGQLVLVEDFMGIL